MNKPKPSYYAILEADVRYDEDLKANEKLLYAEITALSDRKGCCWAMNGYFADLFDVTKQTVSAWISRLVDKGYLDRKIIRDDRKRIKKRVLTPIKKKDNRYKENKGEVLRKKDIPIKKKAKENNTSINTTSTNKNICDLEFSGECIHPDKKCHKKDISCEFVDCPILEIFKFYEKEFDGLYNPRTLSKKRKSKIQARLETYSVDEIKTAIANIRQSDYHIGKHKKNNKFYAKPEFICRNDEKIEEWINYQPRKSASSNVDKGMKLVEELKRMEG